jgi:hypothetical protein
MKDSTKGTDEEGHRELWEKRCSASMPSPGATPSGNLQVSGTQKLSFWVFVKIALHSAEV